jgi:hypothetical protein
MPAVSTFAVATVIAIDDICPGPQPEQPRNLVLCSAHYFVVTRPGHLRRIDASEFERRQRQAPVVSKYFDVGTCIRTGIKTTAPEAPRTDALWSKARWWGSAQSG